MAIGAFTRSEFLYSDFPADGSEPLLYAGLPGVPKEEGEDKKDTVVRKSVECEIHDIRTKQHISLDKNGFFFVPNSDIGLEDAEWDDVKIANEKYLPQLAKLVNGIAGGDFAHARDYAQRNVRTEKGSMVIAPSFQVHADVDSKLANMKARLVLRDDLKKTPEEIEELMKGRIRMINVWRPIRHPAWDVPLAVLDWTSFDPDHDWVPVNIKFPGGHGTRSYNVRRSPTHRWWSIREQGNNDLLLFKSYDSKPGVSCSVPHGAFKHPDYFDKLEKVGRERGIEMRPRNSTEVRVWVFGG